jgi:hypothetical protein
MAIVLVAGFVVPAVSAQGNEVQQKATGEGSQLTGSGTGVRTFAFNAIEHKDGQVTGEAQVENPVINSLRTFRLDCLNMFLDNDGMTVAVASGIVTSAEDPALVGRPGIFAVQDNGEGSKGAPDEMTLGVQLNSTPCTAIPSEEALKAVFPRGLSVINEGNIQVKS